MQKVRNSLEILHHRRIPRSKCNRKMQCSYSNAGRLVRPFSRLEYTSDGSKQWTELLFVWLVIYKKCYITLTVVWIYTIHVCCTKHIPIVAKRSIRFLKKILQEKRNDGKKWGKKMGSRPFFGIRAEWFKIRAQKVFMSSKKNIVNNILRLFQ